MKPSPTAISKASSSSTKPSPPSANIWKPWNWQRLPPPSAESAAETPAITRPELEIAPPRRALAWCVWLLVFLTGAAGGACSITRTRPARTSNVRPASPSWNAMAPSMSRTAAGRMPPPHSRKSKRWHPARKLANSGRRSIEAGMTEEQTQFVGLLDRPGHRRTRSRPPERSARPPPNVSSKNFPPKRKPAALLHKIAAARAGQSRDAAIAAARKLTRRTPVGRRHRRRTANPRHHRPTIADAKTIVADATAALEKHRRRQGQGAMNCCSKPRPATRASSTNRRSTGCARRPHSPQTTARSRHGSKRWPPTPAR